MSADMFAKRGKDRMQGKEYVHVQWFNSSPNFVINQLELDRLLFATTIGAIGLDFRP